VAVKILVVDDSATMRKILEMTFAGENAEVVTIDNGDAAIQKAAELRPQVVFADASMQGTDGYAVAHAVKSNPALAETAVIVLASQHTAFDEGRGRAAGVDDHVLKPFDTQALIDKVQDVLGRPRVRLAAAAAAPVAAPVAAPPASRAPAVPSAGVAAPPPPPPGATRPSSGPSMAALGHARKNTVAFGSPPIPQPPAASAVAQPPIRPSRPVLELAEDAVVEPVRAAEPARPAAPQQPQRSPSANDLPAASRAPVASPAHGVSAAPRAPIASPAQPRPAVHAPVAQAPAAQAPAAQAPAAARPQSPVAAAAVSSANGAMTKRLHDLGLTKDQVEGVLALSKEIIEQVVWEVVPELAETLIKEEIRRLTAE
jgi:CheY-like chemotaxis protein